MKYEPTGGPGNVGITPLNVDLLMNAAQGTANPIAVGDVVRILPSSGILTSGIRATTANGRAEQMFGVALEAASLDGAKFLVRVSGIAEVKCHSAADASTALGVSGANAAHLAVMNTTVPAVGGFYAKQIGIALEDTATTGDLTSVLFEGIDGFSRGAE